MEYFSKFRRTLAPQRSALRTSPEQMLAKFEKCWKYVHRDYFLEKRKPGNVVRTSGFPGCLRTMVDVLVLEQNCLHATSCSTVELGSAGPCLEYLLKNNVLNVLVDVSEPDIPLGLRGEAIRAISTMVQLLDERFLAHAAVHAPVLRLLTMTVSDRKQSVTYQDDLVDLMYNICAVISRYPPLLNIFFYDKAWLKNEESSRSQWKAGTNSTGSHLSKEESNEHMPRMETSGDNHFPHQWEFFLWEYLLRFVHLQGRSGDLARTGLLYLVELADDLVQDYILTQSDFPVAVAAALGALYSQLPRRVCIPSLPPLSGSVSSSTTFRSPSVETGSVDVTSAAYREPLVALLGLLEFCEDALSRCPSEEVTRAVLRKVKTVFLENVVATALVEANEADGSATAVCLYLEAMLGPLKPSTGTSASVARLFVDFLLGDMEPELAPPTPFSTPIDRSAVDVEDIRRRVPTFKIKEFIIRRMRSDQPGVAVAALRLLRTLLARHCLPAYSLLNNASSTEEITLPSKTPTYQDGIYSRLGPAPKDMTSFLDHEYDTATYLCALGSIEPDCVPELLDNYGTYLQSAEAQMIRHCSTPGHHATVPFLFQERAALPQELPGAPVRSTPDASQTFCLSVSNDIAVNSTAIRLRDIVPPHYPATNDTLLQALFIEVGRFFARPPEVNVELTGVLSALALCPCRSLQGWLTCSPSTTIGELSMCKTDRIVGDTTEECPSSLDSDEDVYPKASIDGFHSNGGCRPPPQLFASLCALAESLEHQRSVVEETVAGSFSKILCSRRRDLLASPPPLSPPSQHSGKLPLLFDPGRRVSCPSPSSTSPSSSSRRTSWIPFRSSPSSPQNTRQVRMNATHYYPAGTITVVAPAAGPFSAAGGNGAAPSPPPPPPEWFLDNVVILEESVKELVAIIQVRRAASIEGVQYV